CSNYTGIPRQPRGWSEFFGNIYQQAYCTNRPGKPTAMEKIFFDSWESIIRTSILSVAAYVGLVLILRTAGNRPLTQLNAFDFIVNVAIGSTLATVMLNKNVALADGLLAFVML